MGILKEVADLFNPSDPELVEKTLARIAEQDTWNDVFSTKLIDVLDNVDGLKADLRTRMRSLERAEEEARQSLQQAASHLSRACAIEDKAANDLQLAREKFMRSQEGLDAAQALSEDAKSRHIEAAKKFRKATFWVLCALAISWVASSWAAWVLFRSVIPLWIPCLATILIATAAIGAVKGLTHEG